MTKSTKSGKAAKIGKWLQGTREGICFTKVFSSLLTSDKASKSLRAPLRRKIFWNYILKNENYLNFLLYLNHWQSVFYSVTLIQVCSDVWDTRWPWALLVPEGHGYLHWSSKPVQLPWVSWKISNPMTKWQVGRWIESWDPLSVCRTEPMLVCLNIWWEHSTNGMSRHSSYMIFNLHRSFNF